MSVLVHRLIQLILLVFSLFMIWGGGFFWREALPDNVTRTNTYTLYRNLPPPPKGPRFCPLVDLGSNGLAGPCNFVPPFAWWLEMRYREKRLFDISL